MVQSDTLSRRADLTPDMDDDNDDRTLLPDSLFVNMIDTELNDLIRKTDQTDPVVHSALAALLEGGLFPMKSSLKDWHTTNELVFYKNRCYVPDSLVLRQNVVQKYHNTVSAGHPGCLSTQILVQRDYWWLGIATFIRNYVDGCAVCQQHKINRHPICPPLQPISPEKQ